MCVTRVRFDSFLRTHTEIPGMNSLFHFWSYLVCSCVAQIYSTLTPLCIGGHVQMINDDISVTFVLGYLLHGYRKRGIWKERKLEGRLVLPIWRKGWFTWTHYYLRCTNSYRNTVTLLSPCLILQLPTLQRKSHLCIPFLGIGRPQSHFPHSCACVRIIYSQNRSTYFLAAEKADQLWEYINRSQKHECGNWYCGRAIPFLEIFVSNFSVLCLCSVQLIHKHR